jgi:hypothetical protein
MISQSLQRLALVTLMALGSASCSKVMPIRYKLTLAVNTPDGVKRGSSIVEVSFYQVSIPARGTMHKLRGEALYLDLGPGTRPLIALLTSYLPKGGRGRTWERDAGPSITWMLRMYDQAPSEEYILDVPRLASLRGPRRIAPANLPDLVTFADVKDPDSVIEVDPNDLQATLGQNISWNEMTLESTDEPVTTGIQLKLPWIPYFWCGMLDGSRYSSMMTLSNTLSTFEFDQSDQFAKFAREKHSGDIMLECWKSRTEWLSHR